MTRFSTTGQLVNLPPGFVRTSEWSEADRVDKVFCGYECLMKWCATFDPPELIEP